MALAALAPARAWPALCAVSYLALCRVSGAQPASNPPAPSPPPAAPAPQPSAPPAAQSPPPYGAWSGGYAQAPRDAPPPGPPPRLAAPEYGRRPVELVPSLFLIFPQCVAGDRSSNRCDGVGGGLGIEFSALWRVSPYFAWGGTLAIGGLRYDPPSRLAIRNAGAAAAFIGLLGRVYFIDEGSFDPYLELGLGGGAMATSGREADDVIYDHTSQGGAVRAAAGIDFYLSRTLRLGPSLSWTRIFVDNVRRCKSGGGSCTDLSTDDGYLAGHVDLSVKLTIMIGDEM